ncbi:MAG TPA: hypothetical protein P5136_00640 [Methanofastidiosum sp.]|nr:hypothetical protein [Methanofastidiosum sp.]
MKKNKTKKIRVTIDLPIETLACLAVLSAETDKSVNWLCEKFLREFIKKHKKKTPM